MSFDNSPDGSRILIVESDIAKTTVPWLVRHFIGYLTDSNFKNHLVQSVLYTASPWEMKCPAQDKLVSG